MGVLALCPVLAILGRLLYFQTFKHEEMSARAESAVYAYLEEDRIRGNILDINGVILAESLRTYSAAVLKRYVKDKEETIKTLSKVLEVPEKELRQRWNKEGNFFYVKKKIRPAMYSALNEAVKEKRLTGIELTAEYERIHPFGDMALDLLGAANSKNMGLSGLEQSYNKELSQDISRKRAKRARAGQIIYERELKEEEKISDIYLTIDALAQHHVEEVLKNYVEANAAKRGMAIVQDPNTGYILAIASYPVKDGQSLPFQFTYEPGSTFKTITSASALDSGVWKKERVMEFDSRNTWKGVNGITIRDTHNLTEKTTLEEMMKVSSNRGAAYLANELGAKDFFYYIKAFGFGTKTDIGFQGEARGTVRPFSKWTKVDTAVTGYGYGISLTAVQLINAYSAIANGGYLMQAHIVDRAVDAGGNTVQYAKPKKIRKVLKPETARQMNDVLQQVVSSGTARKAKVSGYTVAGKTGTAEKHTAAGYEKSAHIVSFCGFVPASKPAFTILFVLDEPEKPVFGGESAAPAFAEIAERLLAIKGVRPDIVEEPARKKK